MGKREGFTLIELAIVLVIIGLLVGAVMVGVQMVRQSEIRATLAQVDKFTQAIRIFNDKYGQLPGDFNGATGFWGADSSCPSTAFNQVKKTATCDGNADGVIGSSATSPAYSQPSYEYEWYRAWQHLADAGLIEGQFTGVGGNVSPTELLDYSVPASAYPGGGFTLMYESYIGSATADNYASKAHHVLEVGAPDPACSTGTSLDACITHSPLFTPMDAQDIDGKIDDGNPATGVVLARPSGSTITPNCTTAAPAYNVSYKKAACGLIIDTGY